MKIIRLLLFTILIGSGIPANSQFSEISITPFFDVSSAFTSKNVMDFNIVYSSGQSLGAIVMIDLIESRKNIPIVHLENQNALIANGVNSFKLMDFVTKYFPNEMSRQFEMGKPLSMGNYQICITIKAFQSETQQVRECTTLLLKDELFLQLVSPGNGEEVFSLNPQLTWISSHTSSDIKYHLLLSPLQLFKRPEEAIRQNLKFLDIQLVLTNIIYPLDAPPLVYGKKYAWQVIAVKNNEVIGVTETWVFTPVNGAPEEIHENDCYRIIYRNHNSGNYLYGNIMKFAYKNASGEPYLNYTIHDLSGNQEIPDPPRINLLAGVNKVNIDLKRLKGIKKDHEYLVRIRNSENETFSLTFKPFTKRQ